MGVNTSARLRTTCKDVFLIAERITAALESLIIEPRRQAVAAARQDGAQSRRIDIMAKVNEQWRLPEVTLSPRDRLFQVHFTYQGERRTLWAFFDLECDTGKPAGISLSLGCWGESEYLLRTVCKALSVFGPSEFRACDATDAFELIDEGPYSFAQAAERGLVRGTRLEVRTWLRAAADGHFVHRTPEEVLGISESTVRALLQATDPDQIRALMAAMTNRG